MKLKKYNYIIVLIITLFVGITPIYAANMESCNYISESKVAMAQLEIYSGYKVTWTHGGKDYSLVRVQKLGEKLDNDKETILNWYSNFTDSKVTGITLNAMYNGSAEANKNPSCPEYLIVRTKNNFKSYGAFATNNENEAKKFVNASNQNGEYKAWYLKFKNSNGTKITDEQYYSGFVTTETIIDKDATLTCTELFGDKNKPDSIAYLVDSALKYVRIIVPILVILLGSLDLAKAVIASKEDEMKKAQTTFIKRIILGVVVFFVPVLVDIIMQFSDIVWEGLGYSVCEFK